MVSEATVPRMIWGMLIWNERSARADRGRGAAFSIDEQPAPASTNAPTMPYPANPGFR